MDDLFGNRLVAIKHNYGSTNYNLKIPLSDVDYKYYVIPNLDDLYSGKMYSNAKISIEVDYDVHDIRKLPELLYKANINFMEVLVAPSKVAMFADNYFYANKVAFSTMNLPYLFNSCVGMHFNKKTKAFNSFDTSPDDSYDFKEAHHSIRVLDFLLRFAEMKFTDFSAAITYKQNDENRINMLDLKLGNYGFVQYRSLTEHYFNRVQLVKSLYMDAKPNEDLFDELKNKTKCLVLDTLNS